jgi:hypothetical protein
MVFDRRFSGLPGLAHGGYLAGVLASGLGGVSAEVRLRKPVVTGRRLRLERADRESVVLRDGDALLAEAVPAELSLDVPLPVTLAEAELAAKRYCAHSHPFPQCFACGPERRERDGLRIFTGPVTGRRLVAAPWLPVAEAADESGRVPDELVWAALDCPQLWSLIVHPPAGAPSRVVTATLAARIEHAVRVGEPHVVIAWPIGRDGRRVLAGAAAFGPDGELCAVGRQTAAPAGWGVPLDWLSRARIEKTTNQPIKGGKGA